ncbi:hypothetical protein JYB87_01490 [Shewanella avicenniae]|uniref:Uncharacterized protein n=1 Tax=Shewanella avicenniae TaxID=2814294 RepID=A0ABX7QSN1_9GAMM|nr:HGGxSTG domain-containing protein [Shewanella avicenniae]QSX33956.1 hypothetical protein JYB87_01490 [Shewanella avicenniae]
MARFNLDKLPRCGAKTRSGGTCQRYGNKVNGRCKLHGGRSTGAKTKEGKLALRVNALLNAFVWHFDKHFYRDIKKDDIEKAISAYLLLCDLTKLKTADTGKKATEIVRQYRVELETMKYHIEGNEGPEALVLIQSALDHYYKDNATEHLKFHLYTPVYPAPYFDTSLGSVSELKQMGQILVKADAKKGMFYSPSADTTTHKKMKNMIKKRNIAQTK